MRYLWDLYPDYLHQWTRHSWQRAAMGIASHHLRQWDFSTAARVDDFVANSRNVQQRIWKTYRRESSVIYPPVAVDTFYWRPSEPYYLIVAGLVAYKRIDEAVRCFSKSGRRLKIAGAGPEYRALRKLAKPNIEFCGAVSDVELRDLYAKCRALIMPGEEDFGLTPVEAMASGKAVIALGRGGVLESVPARSPRAGFFYDTPDEQSLEHAIRDFEAAEGELSPLRLQSVAARFSEARFAVEMAQLVAGTRNQSRQEMPVGRIVNGFEVR